VLVIQKLLFYNALNFNDNIISICTMFYIRVFHHIWTVWLSASTINYFDQPSNYYCTSLLCNALHLSILTFFVQVPSYTSVGTLGRLICDIVWNKSVVCVTEELLRTGRCVLLSDRFRQYSLFSWDSFVVTVVQWAVIWQELRWNRTLR